MNSRHMRIWSLTITTACFLLAAVASAQEKTEIRVPAGAFTGQGGGSADARGWTAPKASPGYIHLWYTPGHWAEWSVEVPAAGEYELRVKYATRFDTPRKVEVNGAAAAGLESFMFRKTGGWTRFQDETLPAKVALKAGKNAVRMTCLDDTSLYVAEMRLAESGKPDIVINPLQFSGQGGGKVQGIVTAEHGYFNLWDNRGHWLEWTVEAPADGDYPVVVHYAAMKQPVREVRVNGEVVPGMEGVTFEASGGWRNWVEGALPKALPLKKGTNVIRLTNVEQSQNLAAIVLRDTAGKELLVPAVSFSGQGGGTVRVTRPRGLDSFQTRLRIPSLSTAGQWLEWTFDAPAAGRYNVTIRHAAVENSLCRARVNGVPVEGLFSLSKGSSMNEWVSDTPSVDIILQAGRNVVRLTKDSGGPVILSGLVFTSKE